MEEATWQHGTITHEPRELVLAVLLLVLAALAIIWVIDAIRDDDDVPDIGVTLQEVDADPGAYPGQLLVVGGVIDELVSPRVFTLGNEAFPVVADTDQVVAASVVAQVTGTVEEMTAAELADLGGAPSTLDLFEDARAYVLRAENVVLNPFGTGNADDTGGAFNPEGWARRRARRLARLSDEGKAPVHRSRAVRCGRGRRSAGAEDK